MINKEGTTTMATPAMPKVNSVDRIHASMINKKGTTPAPSPTTPKCSSVDRTRCGLIYKKGTTPELSLTEPAHMNSDKMPNSRSSSSWQVDSSMRPGALRPPT